VEEGEQISHRLRIGLEARHGGGTTTYHLLNELAIIFAVGHPVEIGPHQALGGKAMAARTIQAEQAPAIAGITRQLEGGSGVGVSAQARNQHDQAEQQHSNARHKSKKREQATALGRILPQ
jgi:hypothetical protein